jgi:hypothetical protein
MKPLSDHEAEQVREISYWKSEGPSLLMEAYRGLSRPISKAIARVVPKELVHKALVEVEKLAEKHDPVGDLLKAAGVSGLGDLLGRPLEECDRLSNSVSTRAEHLALLEGVVPAAGGVAIPGVGGAVTAIVDVPILLEATLRAVRRFGHCYGFPLDSEVDRRFVLAILDIANVDNPPGVDEERLGLWATDGPYPAKPDGSGPEDHIEQALIDDLPLESIPFLGDLSNLVLDFAFVRRADITARRVFQERWLRTNEKVESIPPAPGSHRRSSVEGMVRIGSELAYVGAYGVAFGVTFPASLAGSFLASVVPGSVLRGFQDGALAADRDALDVLEGFRRSIQAERAVPIPSTA